MRKGIGIFRVINKALTLLAEICCNDNEPAGVIRSEMVQKQTPLYWRGLYLFLCRECSGRVGSMVNLAGSPSRRYGFKSRYVHGGINPTPGQALSDEFLLLEETFDLFESVLQTFGELIFNLEIDGIFVYTHCRVCVRPFLRAGSPYSRRLQSYDRNVRNKIFELFQKWRRADGKYSAPGERFYELRFQRSI